VTALLALVALATLAAVAVVAINTVKRRKAVAALPPADRQHYDAIRATRKELRTATRDHDAAVRGVERDLSKVQKPQKLASVGGHTLFDDTIKTPTGTHRLTDAVTATVDTAGNLATKSRSTLSRIGAGAVIAGPLGLLVGATAKKSQTIDKRELYLLIDGGDWASSEQLNPDRGAEARKFAQAGTWLPARSTRSPVSAPSAPTRSRTSLSRSAAIASTSRPPPRTSRGSRPRRPPQSPNCF
jgi:hypothetical protein